MCVFDSVSTIHTRAATEKKLNQIKLKFTTNSKITFGSKCKLYKYCKFHASDYM